MRVVLIIAIFALAIQDAHLTEPNFINFKIQHNKYYPTVAEEQRRAVIFESNLLKIEEHNKRYAEEKETYKMGVNQFADLTHEEFTSFLKMQGLNPTESYITKVLDKVDVGASDAVDWRDKNAVTDIKNQGNCGSCWAFSATGSLESQYFLKTGQLLSLSEQQLVDCSGDYGNIGCNGGFMLSAFIYIRDNGIAAEDQYPYTAVGGVCTADTINMTAINVTGFTATTPGSEEVLAYAIDTFGPISASLDATYFQFYDSGVFTDNRCGNTTGDMNHGILTVGYTSDYWIIKNSWGKSWGESGYIRLSRDLNNHCGIANMASFPNVQ